MSVFVSIALASICFTYNGAEECHPVLLGKSNPTPVGEFVIRKRITNDKGYGGDVLQFHEDEKGVYAIHRVWLLKPSEKRRERLNSSNVQDRFITNGCINIDEEAYKRLFDCCSYEPLIIK